MWSVGVFCRMQEFSSLILSALHWFLHGQMLGWIAQPTLSEPHTYTVHSEKVVLLQTDYKGAKKPVNALQKSYTIEMKASAAGDRL